MITANAQLENSNWIFGNNVNLNFPNDTSTPNQISPNIAHQNSTSASVSNELGELLFYVDRNSIGALVIKNKFGTQMPNGDLSATQVIQQNSVIVKKPGSCSIYYVFTFKNNNPNYGYRYTEVNMSLNDGLGDVTTNKELPLLTDLGYNFNLNTPIQSPKMTSYSSDEINHTWLVTEYSNFFYSYKIDNTGVHTTAVESDNVLFNNLHNQGVMKISPNGKKLATTNYGISPLNNFEVHIYEFNHISGLISNSGYTNINSVISKSTRGLEFSPSSDQLYFTTSHANNIIQNGLLKKSITNKKKQTDKLYQYTIGKKATVPFIVASSSSNGHFRGLQRAINNKIYIAQGNSPTFGSNIGVINMPNISGELCDYTPSAFLFNDFYPGTQFPQWVHKSGASISESWALNFGELYSNSFAVRRIRDIETDSEGNTYVLGSRLNQQSPELTTLANGIDFTTTGRSFISKFDVCKNLIANYTFPGILQDHYGQIHITNDDSVYVEINLSGGSLYKLNQDLVPEWSVNHNIAFTESYFIDKANNNVYLNNNNSAIISKINTADNGSIENSFTNTLPLSGGIADNNILYIAGRTSSNTAHITKLTYNAGTYTQSATQSFTFDATIHDNIILRHSGATDLVSVAIAAKQLQGDPNGYDFANHNFNVHTFDSSLNLVSTIINNGIISDIKYNGVNNELLVATHANNTGANFLSKYNALTGALLWQANETFGANDLIFSPNISTFNDKILMTGLYKNSSNFSQTNIPNSLNNTVNLFTLQLKDLGTSFEYRTTTNIGLTLEANNGFIASDKKENIFTVFPNPFNNTLNISATTKNKTYTINISDFVGTNKLNIVYNTTLHRNAILNTSKLTKGVYVLRIIENDIVVHTRKLIK